MWQGIYGHDEIVERFRQTLRAGRLASTYLFVGPAGTGKRRFALELAHSLLCTNSAEANLDPCGVCDSCRMFAAGTHPDLEVVGLPADKTTLPIKLFIGDDEHRNKEGLCHNLGLRPFFGRRRIAIVDEADHFSIPSANCLLKTLEEPPASALLILVGTSPSRQLPTIRSRSQVVRFSPLAADVVAELLIATGVVSDRVYAEQIASLSDGSLERAKQLADRSLWEFRTQLLAALRAARLDSVRLARAVQSFVDEAGKEAAQRRERLRTIIGFALEFYRGMLRESQDGGTMVAVSQLDSCLLALEQIERNANVGLVIQHWCESLSQVSHHGPGGIQRLAQSNY